jgi:hypothetical protein
MFDSSRVDHLRAWPRGSGTRLLNEYTSVRVRSRVPSLEEANVPTMQFEARHHAPSRLGSGGVRSRRPLLANSRRRWMARRSGLGSRQGRVSYKRRPRIPAVLRFVDVVFLAEVVQWQDARFWSSLRQFDSVPRRRRFHSTEGWPPYKGSTGVRLTQPAPRARSKLMRMSSGFLLRRQLVRFQPGAPKEL